MSGKKGRWSGNNKFKYSARAHVVCVQSLCLNLKIDIYIQETPGGAHDEVMRGVS